MAVLWVAVDTSGSMKEGHKLIIARNIVRTVEQYFRLGYASAEIKLLAVSDEVREISWNPDEEYPKELLDCARGTFNGRELVSFLRDSSDYLLVVTDASWDLGPVRALKRFPLNHLRIVKVGSEQSLPLKGMNCSTAEDILALIDQWIGT